MHSRASHSTVHPTMDPFQPIGSKAAFDAAERGIFALEAEDRCETVERNGGRTERRTGTLLGDPGLDEWVADPKEWPGLRGGRAAVAAVPVELSPPIGVLLPQGGQLGHDRHPPARRSLRPRRSDG